MQYVLFLVGVLMGVLAVFITLLATTSIGQILGGVLLIVSAVLVSGAAIIESVERLRKEVRSASPR